MLQTSIWEWFAVIAAIAYLVLAVKKHIACWAAALISTAIYTVLYWDVTLYMESALNAYYLGMAIYGYWCWSEQKSHQAAQITTWPWQNHLIAISVIMLTTGISGFTLSKSTDASVPYLDSFTTWAAVVTTYMVAKKVLENWIYWLIINGVAMIINIDRCLLLTTMLLGSYQIIAIFGFIAWWKDWNGPKSRHNAQASNG